MNRLRSLPWKQTFHLAWPVALANLSFPMLGLVDASVLGHLDNPIFLAGVALGSSLIAFVFWGFNFLAMGLSGVTSSAYGAHNPGEIKTHLTQYAIVASTLIFMLLLLHKPLIEMGLQFMNSSPEVEQQARIYLQIRAWGIPAMIFNSMLIGFFTGMQNTRIGLYTVSVSQIINLVLNVVLVFRFNMSTNGIALGTVISEYIGVTFIFIALLKRYKRLGGTINWQLLLNVGYYKPMLATSFNLLIRSFLLLFSVTWLNKLSAQINDQTLAVNAILLSLFTLISNTQDATASAAEAQTGLALGAGNRQKLKEILITTGMIALAFSILLSLIFILLKDVIIHLMTNQTALQNLVSHNFIWVQILPLLAVLAFWLDGVFIGARLSGDMRNSVIAGFFGFFLISHFIPQTPEAVWCSFCLTYLVRSTWLLRIFLTKIWKKIVLEHQEECSLNNSKNIHDA
ncbi:MATE family efflux transporter [Gynuella sunshinyii]|uniref:MATE family efflux transporter n=1 Tax=Gynuella sunshinyii TaxID=1445505 RepID=UPI0011848A80|nr:MATE family efflux transporter [Gynuella sunshinyii]